MKDRDPGKVSVVIPVYNTEKYIGEAVESVLSQSVPPFEVIVVDDGSTDKTAEVIRRFSSKVISLRQENAGANTARNLGLRRATGNFYALLDGDDLWEPEKLEKQLEVFYRNGETDSVFCHVQNFYSPEMDEEIRRKLQAPMEPMAGQLPSAILIKKSAFLRVGYFKPGISMGDFMQWLMRSREAGLREVVLPEVLVKRRIHGANVSSRQNPSLYLGVLREALKRRRHP